MLYCGITFGQVNFLTFAKTDHPLTLYLFNFQIFSCDQKQPAVAMNHHRKPS
jgi:hypothetical protein